MRFFDPERIHETHQLGGHLVHRKTALLLVAAAGAALVVGDDAITLAEDRQLRFPITADATQAAHEYQRVSAAGLLILDFPTCDSGFAHFYSVLWGVTVTPHVTARRAAACGNSVRCLSAALPRCARADGACAGARAAGARCETVDPR